MHIYAVESADDIKDSVLVFPPSLRLHSCLISNQIVNIPNHKSTPSARAGISGICSLLTVQLPES